MMTLGIRNGFGVPTGGSALLSKSRTRVCLPVHCCSRLNLRKSICNERGGLHDSFRGSIITRAAAGRPTAVGQSGKQPSSARGSDSAGVVVDSAGVSPDIEPVSGFGWRKTLWTLVDVIAIVGSVGGALAAMLNLFASSYPVLLLPLCLPALSLLAALQREGLIAEDNARRYDSLSARLTRDSAVLLNDARVSIDEVRRELKSQSSSTGKLGLIEARLGSLEGSILSAGRSAREAAAGVVGVPERVQKDQRAQYDALVAAVRGELRRAGEAWSGEDAAAFARMDTRLASLEGSLSGLELSQSEGMRRLSMGLNSALADAEASLQTSVRNEVFKSMDPVRRLPQMLAAAMPSLDPDYNQSYQRPQLPGSGFQSGSNPASSYGQVSPDQLRLILSQEIELTLQRLMLSQEESLVGRVVGAVADASRGSSSVMMDDEQWDALGRKLNRLERLLEAVPENTEGRVSANVLSGMAAQAQGARLDMVEAVASEFSLYRQTSGQQHQEMLSAVSQMSDVINPMASAISALRMFAADAYPLLQQAAQAPQSYTTQDRSGSPPLPQQQIQDLAEIRPQLALLASLLQGVDTRLSTVASSLATVQQAAEQTQWQQGQQLDQLQQLGQQQRSAADSAAAAAAAAAAAQQMSPAMTVATASATAAASAAAAAAAVSSERERASAVELRRSVDVMQGLLESLTSSVAQLAAQQQTMISQQETQRHQHEQERQQWLEEQVTAKQQQASSVIHSSSESLLPGSNLPAHTSAATAATETVSPTPAVTISDIAPTFETDAMQVPSETVVAAESEKSQTVVYESMDEGSFGNSYHSIQIEEEVKSVVTTSTVTETAHGPTAAVQAYDLAQDDKIDIQEFDSDSAQPQEQQESTRAVQGQILHTKFEQEGEQQQQADEKDEEQRVQQLQQRLQQLQQERQQAEEQLEQQNQQPSFTSTPLYEDPYYADQELYQQPAQYQEPATYLGYDGAYSAPNQVTNWSQSQSPSSPSVPQSYQSGQSQRGEESPSVMDDQGQQVQQQQRWQQEQQRQQQFEAQQWQQKQDEDWQAEQQRLQQQQEEQQQREQEQLRQQQQAQQDQEQQRQWQQQQSQQQSQQRQQQQQQPLYPTPSDLRMAPSNVVGNAQTPRSMDVADLSGGPDGSSGASGFSSSSPSQYEMISLSGLSYDDVVREGVRLLKLGRDEAAKAEDFGVADRLFSLSIKAFTTAVNDSPGDSKALGNLGNALLASGELKKAFLAVVRGGPPPVTPQERKAQNTTEESLRSQSNALLISAGKMFQQVMELNGWSSRALVNWGRAMCVRAELAYDADTAAAVQSGLPDWQQQQQRGGGGSGSASGTGIAEQLYQKAIDKFEAVLEAEPDKTAVKYRCALAMLGLSRCKVLYSRESLQQLMDCINYLRDVVNDNSEEAMALRQAAGEALSSAEQELENARNTRR